MKGRLSEYGLLAVALIAASGAMAQQDVAEAEKNLDVLSQPEVEDVHFERGAPMTFVAVVETRPTIEVGEIQPFDLPEGSVTPDGGEIQDAIRDLRRQHATWSAVERAAATGDLVMGKVLPADAPEDTEGEPPEESRCASRSAPRASTKSFRSP